MGYRKGEKRKRRIRKRNKEEYATETIYGPQSLTCLLSGPLQKKIPGPCSETQISSFYAPSENPSMAPHHSQDKAFTPSFDPACHLAFTNITSTYTLHSRSAELLELSEHTTGCHSCINTLSLLLQIPFSSHPHGKLFL